MRILIDQLADINAEHVRSALELQKEHEIVYWIRIESEVPLDKDLFPKTVFHDYLDAVNNIPAPGIDTLSFEPWGSDEIRAYAAWESELLSMMDKGRSDWPVDKRKDFYYEMLRYWGGILDTTKPDLVFFNAPPHQVFNFVLYAIAKTRGIRTMVCDVSFRPDRIIASEDYRDGNQALARIKREGYSGPDIAADDLPAYLAEYYRKVSTEPEPTPQYLLEFKRATVPAKNLWRRVLSLVPHIKDGTIFERGSRRLFRSFRPNLRSIYQRLQDVPDLESPYIYVPLHYQPECTTSPQGGIYVDQLLIIRTLSAALPVGWKLYVKEHPAQWPSHWGDFTPQRYHGFYEAVAAVPNVQLVPMETSTFRLVDKARATATASGTAGWESVMRGKPSLVFGYPWYMHAPGVFRVSSVDECRAAFKLITGGFVPEHMHMLRFLKEVTHVIIPGTLSLPANVVMDASPEEQWKGMLRIITESPSNS